MTFPEGSLTVASLITEVQDTIRGYVLDQAQSTTLSGSITANATTFAVMDPTQVSRGLVEIDDELVYVTVVDPASGAAAIAPWGRGQSGSTAAAHDDGARVTQSPLVPRTRVASALYGVLREIFPDVYAVGETTLSVDVATTNYEMPIDCYHLIAVEWHLPGPTGQWLPAKRWRQNKTATAVELELLSATWPGTAQCRVRYIRVPPATLSGTDDLTAYGYDNQVRDLMVLGATARIIAFMDTARVQASALESHGRSEAVPAGSATNVAKFLYQLFSKRFDDERRQIQLRHPIQLHLTR